MLMILAISVAVENLFNPSGIIMCVHCTRFGNNKVEKVLSLKCNFCK